MKLDSRIFPLALLLLVALLQATGQIGPMPLASFTGTVRDMDGKTLALDGTDSDTLHFFCSRKTRYYSGSKKIKSSDIRPGSRVTVESKTARDGELEAVNVRLEPRKPPTNNKTAGNEQ
jgi:hypothetical protein